MGGDLAIGHGESPAELGNQSDLVGPMARLVQVEELLSEICSLDCGTLNFGDGNMIYVSTPGMLRAHAKRQAGCLRGHARVGGRQRGTARVRPETRTGLAG